MEHLKNGGEVFCSQAGLVDDREEGETQFLRSAALWLDLTEEGAVP